MHRLVDAVESLVSSNNDIRIRLDALEIDPSSAVMSIPSRTPTLELNSSRGSEFSQSLVDDLGSSRAYRRRRIRDSLYSLSNSERGSMALSAFSEMSLGNISAISVFCLPIWSTDLSNSSHYRFGQEGLILTIDELTDKYPNIDFVNTSLKESRNPREAQKPDLKLESEMDAALKERSMLFVAASLFYFSLSETQKEGGYPYLQYVPGEVNLFPLFFLVYTLIDSFRSLELSV